MNDKYQTIKIQSEEIINCISDGIVQLDLMGKILMINKSVNCVDKGVLRL